MLNTEVPAFNIVTNTAPISQNEDNMDDDFDNDFDDDFDDYFSEDDQV